MAIVWDGEVRGLTESLEMTGPDSRILILSDSQAAVVAAMRKARRKGKARTWDLVRVMQQVKERTDQRGAGAIRFAWVKVHIGLPGNERAGQLAKEGALRLERGSQAFGDRRKIEAGLGVAVT